MRLSGCLPSCPPPSPPLGLYRGVAGAVSCRGGDLAASAGAHGPLGTLWEAPGQDLGARQRRQVFPVGPAQKRVGGGGGGAGEASPGPSPTPHRAGPPGVLFPAERGRRGRGRGRGRGRAGARVLAAAAPGGAWRAELRQGAARARGHASRAAETTTPRPLGGRGRPAPPRRSAPSAAGGARRSPGRRGRWGAGREAGPPPIVWLREPGRAAPGR